MHQVLIKPLSLNSAYRGRRFKTPELEDYKERLSILLPKEIKINKQGLMGLELIFGVSSKNSDGDNLIKCFQDALATKYDFNDKQIVTWTIDKVYVKKGKEFVQFKLYNVSLKDKQEPSV